MAKASRTRLEMPFAMDPPVLVRRELGIVEIVQRGGKRSFTMDVTLLDSPDNRLLRAGVVLAHRVVDGLGEWYLDAPGWKPYLPTERSEPLGAAGDLPDEFASLVRPFRRSAALGPVAAVTCKRVEWSIRGAEAVELAVLRDDRLTVRRAGVIVGRYREVTLTARDALTKEQRSHLMDALGASGGQVVDQFPRLAERLGAPATGLSDFGPEPEWRDDFTLEGFVRWLLGRRLDKLVRADLALRSGRESDLTPLAKQLVGLHRELKSLAFAFDPEWLAAVDQDLVVVFRQLPSTTVHGLGEAYFRVLDALVAGVRAPRLGDRSQHQAKSEIRTHVLAGMTILFDRARSLTLASPDERWAATLASARQMQEAARLGQWVFGKRARKLSSLVGDVVELLAGAQAGRNEVPVKPEDWSVEDAYEAGRTFERTRLVRDVARERFIEQWPSYEQAMRAVRKK